MDLISEVATRQTLQIWESRQKTDGTLLTAVSLASLVPVVTFALTPGAATAWTLGLFLFALAYAAKRLIESTSKVARLRHSLQFAPSLERLMLN